MPEILLHWTYSFLEGRSQCVKIGNITSEWKKNKGAVPQGTLFGMEGFIVHIDDLQLINEIIKYVDDATTFESIPSYNIAHSNMPLNLKMLETWTEANEMKLNTKKTKEMCFSFSKARYLPDSFIDGHKIEQVKSFKLVGVEVSENLSWNNHIESIVKKNNCKLYYLKLLKRSGVSPKELIMFYTSIIRSAIEYAAPVWGNGLPGYLMDNLENLQKRAMRTIFPDLQYKNALTTALLPSIATRIDNICRNFFQKIQHPDDRIHHLLPEKAVNYHNTRNKRIYPLPHLRTEKTKKSFIYHSLFHYQ